MDSKVVGISSKLVRILCAMYRYWWVDFGYAWYKRHRYLVSGVRKCVVHADREMGIYSSSLSSLDEKSSSSWLGSPPVNWL